MSYPCAVGVDISDFYRYNYFAGVRQGSLRRSATTKPSLWFQTGTDWINAMPFVPVPNTALVEVRMLLDGQQVENTLWFEFAADPSAGDLTGLASEIEDWWITNIAPNVSDGLQLREIVASNMATNTGPQVSLTTPIAQFGAQTSPPLPSNVSLTVSFRTAARGRSFRGRNYIVGLVEDQNTGNVFTVGTVNAFRTAYEQLLPTGGAGITPVWVVVSRFSGVGLGGLPIPRVVGVTTPVTTVLVVDPIVDSQRRRLPGRGN